MMEYLFPGDNPENIIGKSERSSPESACARTLFVSEKVQLKSLLFPFIVGFLKKLETNFVHFEFKQNVS